MFIRETIKFDRTTGKKYSSYQLVESFRTPSGPRQKILLTVGVDVNLTISERKELANRIEEITKGTLSFFCYSDHIESLAQHFAQLLMHKKELIKPVEDRSKTDYHRVDLNSIHHKNVRKIGCEYIALSAYRELAFDDIFERLNLSPKKKLVAAAAIIGRAIYPFSERSLHDHLKSRSGLDALLDTSFAKLSLDQLYLISDDLYQSKNKIEKHLREKEKTLFNLQESIILYDITNTYFEGTCKRHPKAKRGKSKEMRSDCPLVAVGVVLDAEGFPKHSEIFDGNVNERATLEEMILRLNRSEMLLRPIIVLDSGIATKDNIDWLKSQEYSYIVMMKRKERPSSNSCRDIIIRNSGNQFVSASLKYDKETDDHILWCYSDQRRKKEQDIKLHKSNAMESALNYLKEGLTSRRRMKSLEKIHQKIGRLREKYSRLAQHYNITVHPSEDGTTVQNITWTYDAEKVESSFSGTYTLRTNVKDLSAERIWEIYIMLSGAESCFRCLKSEAGLRPNWHSREDRIDSHIFISLLAYHLIATIRRRLKDHGINDSWETVREKLDNHVLVTTVFKNEKETIYLKQGSEPDEYQKSIYRALGLSIKPKKAEKIILKNEDVVSNFC